MLKLGTEVTDITAGQVGMLTHMQVEMNLNEYYNFQPRGLNPKTGEPVDVRWLVDSSIEGGVEVIPPYLPLELLGSQVTDNASGFAGTVVSLRLHINGCVHASVQSSQILETGTVPLSVDFDIRRLSGEKIPVLTDEALETSQSINPSPMKTSTYRPR